ncbi:MAG: hypothetical protein ACO1OQ_09060 [Rufibacter sp.]
MEINITPASRNLYPLGGVLIKSATVQEWVRQLQLMGVTLSQVEAYPVPDKFPNSVWGCFVLFKNGTIPAAIGRNSYYQALRKNIFLPEYATLQPTLSEQELEKLFPRNLHLFHPEVGLVELEEPVNWLDLLELPEPQSIKAEKPAKGVFIPSTIKSFQVFELPPEEVLQKMEEELFPEKEPLPDKPLNLLEKAKLGVLGLFFQKQPKNSKASEQTPTKPATWLSKMAGLFAGRGESVVQKLQLDFEELERRNQSEVDKLLDLFRKNPEEALKYSIPLDLNGSSRGGHEGLFKLSKYWGDFSLFGSGSYRSSSRGGGASILPNEHFQRLQAQYTQAAQDFIEKKQFHKAAFVYMKLLKNEFLAAQTLENGGHFSEAAAIYLKIKAKENAAACYEKGGMVSQSIELYKELNNHEKVGDLYARLNKTAEATHYYEKVVSAYRGQGQYVKAALLYRNKIGDTTKAQSLLLDGWRNEKDAVNCLNNYFTNIQDTKVLLHEIESVYAQETTPKNREKFLQVLKHEYKKHPDIADSIKEIAYEIIAAQLPGNPNIASELNSFSKKDKNLTKDILTYKLNRKALR